MKSFRLHVAGILAALVALMVQVAVGAIVPQPDPVATVLSSETFCHTGMSGEGSNHKTPPLDCLTCPLCVAVHAQTAVALPDVPVLLRPPSGSLSMLLPSAMVSPLPVEARAVNQARAPPTI